MKIAADRNYRMLTKVAATGTPPQEWSPSQSIIDNDFGGDAAKAFEYYHRMAVNQSQKINSQQAELSQLQESNRDSVRQTDELMQRLVLCETGQGAGVGGLQRAQDND